VQMVIESLKPIERLRVMDLVASVGIDVSDWANFKGGEERAASNPKYCYEWSYEDRDKQLIVLSLWYENIEMLDGEIVQKLNLRETAKDVASLPQSRRAIKMDFSLQKATRLNWPVRVIICDGRQREANATKSKADSRILDGEQWHIEDYDSDNGDCLLVRGLAIAPFIDQFELDKSTKGQALRKETTTSVFERSPQIRSYVLKRASGFCELCGEKGFKTSAGSIYLESHHIQPLSEEGSDSIDNVIALCPNHHREAHYGVNNETFKRSLLMCVEKLSKSMQPTANASVD
jgi:5-methylcytosine-specific restriction protein A